MVWLKFTADFSFKPSPAVTQDFRRDSYANVTTACARAAKDAGKAIEEEPPERLRSATVKVRPKVMS